MHNCAARSFSPPERPQPLDRTLIATPLEVVEATDLAEPIGTEGLAAAVAEERIPRRCFLIPSGTSSIAYRCEVFYAMLKTGGGTRSPRWPRENSTLCCRPHKRMACRPLIHHTPSAAISRSNSAATIGRADTPTRPSAVHLVQASIADLNG